MKFKDLLEAIVEQQIITLNLAPAKVDGLYEPGLIYIDDNLSNRKKVETLVHEGIHAYSDLHNLGWIEPEVIRETNLMMGRLYGKRKR